MAVLRALVSCQVRLGHDHIFGWDIGDTLAQRHVCFYLSIFIGRRGSASLNSFQVPVSYTDALLSLSNQSNSLTSPVGSVTEENQ